MAAPKSVFVVLREQPELRRIAGRLGEAEMLKGVRGDQPAARRPLQKTLLDQKWLDDLLDGIARLGQRGGERLNADRTAAVVLGDGREVAAVHRVEACRIDLELEQRAVGELAVDLVNLSGVSEVAHAPQ